MIRYFAIILIVVLVSCDPISSREGITLPVMEFGLKVSPDTAYLKLGDTITLKGSIPSTLSNGVKIEEGKAAIDLYMGYTPQIPITEFSFETISQDNQTRIIVNKGDIRIAKNNGNIAEIYALPYGDSIQVEIAFVPLKKGTYGFQVQSLFYEGKKGKTRTVPKFDMPNDHYDELWRIEGDNNERQKYLFAVTD